MKTKFENLNQLKTLIEIGQPLFIENHILSNRSRVTKVFRKQSYFFTVDHNGKESWIINGATDIKKYKFTFNPERESVSIFFKHNDMPFVTLHFSETIIKEKMETKEQKKVD
jgi:hypothetical protein